MRLRALVLLAALARLAPAQDAACRPIDTDRILARDLAAALPAFAPIPAETWLANAPQPGSKRIMRAAELRSLAGRYAIDYAPAADVCFEWSMRPLDRELVRAAMVLSLQLPDAQIEIAETSLYQVPPGRIEFPRDRLGAPASPEQRDPVLWRGDVVYGGEHRYAVWARVRIHAPCQRTVAAENLAPGRVIGAAQLRRETRDCFPVFGRQASLDKSRIVGMQPLRMIPAGAEIRPDLLASPYDIARGDLVEVEVRSGGARLKLNGRAQSPGRVGDTIPIVNPATSRVFQARVSGKDTAVVQTDPAKEN